MHFKRSRSAVVSFGLRDFTEGQQFYGIHPLVKPLAKINARSSNQLHYGRELWNWL